MWQESPEKPDILRSGLTTGCCATACCSAAAQALLSKQKPAQVDVDLPVGKTVTLKIENYTELADGIKTSTIKDAGDDPDVTQGAKVFVELRLTKAVGVCFKAATGVGIIGCEGLALAVGEPAINPTPRKMISKHLNQIAEICDYKGGFEVAIGVENGEIIALKTMNPKLGITGGLSILGTTGIVRPFSCSAYIAAIRQGIDVAAANGIKHVAATTGSTSEAAIRQHYELSDMALIEMGDFIGVVLKHLKKVSMTRLSICGGFAKITKFAQGHLNLNSRVSTLSFDYLAEQAASLGADAELLAQIRAANTSGMVLAACNAKQINIATAICQQALKQAQLIISNHIKLDIHAVDFKGCILASVYDSSFEEN